MITKTNYFEKQHSIDPASLTEVLKEGFYFTKDITDNYKNWAFYEKDKSIRETVDEYIADLNVFLTKKTTDAGGADLEKTAREAAKKFIRGYVTRGDSVESLRQGQMGKHGGDMAARIIGNKIHLTELNGKTVNFSFPLQSVYNEVKEESGNGKPATQSSRNVTKIAKKSAVAPKTENAKEVERIDEEVRFIKRYALMHGKVKPKEQILNFINGLQRAILEKRIRKTSPYAKEIQYIQTNLVRLYNKLHNIKQIEIKVDKGVLARFLRIGNSEKIRLSIAYLKRYIGIQGKNLNKEKIERLLHLMGDAVKKGKIKSSDPYADRLDVAFDSLNQFLKVAKGNDTLEVHPGVLNGINQALGCACEEGLNGVEPSTKRTPTMNRVMSSMDFSNMKFDTLGFTGKWQQLIGDPCEGFSAMVFGKPKMGKSYLCVDFAGYLARHHGDTLYVAKEEKLDATLQKKLNDKNVKHPCLFVSDHLPKDLSPYRFIFLDSVNKLGLSPQDLERLQEENPGKSFIDVHQTTKDGKFRGTNEYQHDVDVVIEVPEKGRAVQFGRFNQGGEMQIFEDKDYKLAA